MSCLIWIEWANKRGIGERRRHKDYKFFTAMTAQSTHAFNFHFDEQSNDQRKLCKYQETTAHRDVSHER